MKTEEDEAFDDLAKRQGMWGGGFPAKRAMAADKLHWSDCAVHNGPAYPAGECDCGAAQDGKCKYCVDGCAACDARAQPAQEPVREALKRIAEKLRRAGASIPAPQVTGTIEGSVVSGLCVALAIVEGEIEALAQPAQEPVAQSSKEHLKIMMEHSAWDDRLELSDALANIDEFYATAPPKREWVGLTDEDRKAALLTGYKEWECEELLLCAREDYLLIEQALKEKNG